MKETLQLSRIGRADEVELVLDVDVDAGTLGGEDADLIQLALDAAKADGYILGTPYPTSYPYTGDFKTDLARILVAEDYVLPDDWMAAAKLEAPGPVKDGVVY